MAQFYSDADIKKFDNKIDELEDTLNTDMNNKLYPTLELRNKATKIVLDFVKKKKRKIYGGYAQHKLISHKDKKDGFYDESKSHADVDFYTPSPITDAMELVNELTDKGFSNVSAQEAQHIETYSVFAEFVNVADLSYVPTNIYNRIPFVEIDGFYYVGPKFILIDMFKMLTDPLTSGVERWKKTFPRIYKLFKHYPWERAKKPLKKRITLDSHVQKLSDSIFNHLIDNEKAILCGDYAYNYLLHISGIMKDKRLGGKYRYLNISKYEVIATEYVNETKEIYEILEKIVKDKSKLKLTEYTQLWTILGYSSIIEYDGIELLHIIDYYDLCIPIKKVPALKFDGKKVSKLKGFIRLGSYDYNLLYNFKIYQRYRIKKDKEKSYDQNVMISHLIEIRNYFFKSSKKNMFDNTIFEQFITKCIGHTERPAIEARLRRQEKARKKQRIIWSYRPGNDGKRAPQTNFKFMNRSGNPINNPRYFKIPISRYNAKERSETEIISESISPDSSYFQLGGNDTDSDDILGVYYPMRPYQSWPPNIGSLIVSKTRYSPILAGNVVKFINPYQAIVRLTFNKEYTDPVFTNHYGVNAKGFYLLTPSRPWDYINTEGIKRLAMYPNSINMLINNGYKDFKRRYNIQDGGNREILTDTIMRYSIKPLQGVLDKDLLDRYGLPDMNRLFTDEKIVITDKPYECTIQQSKERDILREKLKRNEKIKKEDIGMVYSSKWAYEQLMTKENEVKVLGGELVKWINENISGKLLDYINAPPFEYYHNNGYLVIKRAGCSIEDKITKDMVGDLKYYGDIQYGRPIDYDTFKYLIFRNDIQNNLKQDQEQLEEVKKILSQEYVIALQPDPSYQAWALKRLLLCWLADDVLFENVRYIKVLINHYRGRGDQTYNQENGVMPSILIYPKYGIHSHTEVLSTLGAYFFFYIPTGWEFSDPTYFIKVNDLLYYKNGYIDITEYSRLVGSLSNLDVPFNDRYTGIEGYQDPFDKIK